LLQPSSACWALESRRARPVPSDAAVAAGWKAISTTPSALTASMAADTSAAARCATVATGCPSTTWARLAASLRCRTPVVTLALPAAATRASCPLHRVLRSRPRCRHRRPHRGRPPAPACKAGRRTMHHCPFSQRATSRCTIPDMRPCLVWVVKEEPRLKPLVSILEHRESGSGCRNREGQPAEFRNRGLPCFTPGLSAPATPGSLCECDGRG
jgi:hypothetical protein